MGSKTELIYWINCAPLSLNHMYSNVMGGGRMAGRRFLNPKAKRYKASMIEDFAIQDYRDGDRIGQLRKKPSIVAAEFHLALYYQRAPTQSCRTAFYYKNGKMQRHDVSNMVKPIEDAHAEYLSSAGIEFDDRQNVLITAGKYIADQNGIFVKFVAYHKESEDG